MKFTYINSVLITVLTLSSILACTSSSDNCDPPEKPKGLSHKVKWVGGCDGGNWIELVKIWDKKYRFKVYRDWDGGLSIDADFVINNCKGLVITESNWQDMLNYYILDESDSSAKIFTKQGECYLQCLLPAYGGEDWAAIKRMN